MRKKTKKFYFYNASIKNPAVNSLFCFSSRGLRQNRYIKARFKYEKKKKTYLYKFYKYTNNTIWYEHLIWRKLTLNHWNLNRHKLKLHFVNSSFVSIPFVRKHNLNFVNHQGLLKFWFKVKNIYTKDWINTTRNYPKFGILSSQVAHVLSRKNLSYQVWSKYRSVLVNMAFYNKWLYTTSNKHLKYIAILLSILYTFSQDPRVRSLYYDDDLNTIISPTTNINLRGNNHQIGGFVNSNRPAPLGPIDIDSSLEQLNYYLTNNAIVEEILQKISKKKKDDINNNSEVVINGSLSKDSIIIFSRFFIISYSNEYHAFLLNNLIFLWIHIYILLKTI